MIDFYASEAHFVEHLAATWRHLRWDLAGEFFVPPDLVDFAHRIGVEVRAGEPFRHRRRVVVVASGGDLRLVSRIRSQVVLCEHGAGQSYSNRHVSYAGGLGREKVVLFLVPNEFAAERNRRYYPTTPNAVVGSPRVEVLRSIEHRPAGRPVVAVSFHWRCEVAPEAGTAWDHYVGHLERIRSDLDELGLDVIGHAHPNLWREAEEAYRGAGIEPVRSWPEVVARANVYAVDNSSTLFEFAATGRPVMVLNAPWFRRHVDHGLRFWNEAEVGLQVDRPEDFAAVALVAVSDPPEVARVREEVIGRVYPVLDGAARVAAREIEVLTVGRRCPVCGEAHASCGTPTEVVTLDDRTKGATVAGGLKRYPNPAKPGAFVMLNDRDARRLGLLGTSPGPISRPRPARIDEILNEGTELDPGAVATAPAPPPPPGPAPKGALQKAGPTYRARLAAQQAAGDPAEEEAEDDGQDERAPAPSHKARPAPSTSSSTRRRRRPVTEGA